MKCSVCGMEFAPTKSWQVNCSYKCKSKKKNLKRKDKIKEYNFIKKFSPISRYNAHKQTAKRRKIDFYLTFEEWWDIWQPFWYNRGREKDNFVMCRVGDCGAYEKTNVYIDTYSNNSALAAKLQEQLRDNAGRFISENY